MSAPGSATATDVPSKYDLVINGFGYCLLDSLESSIPFRTHRAIYGQTQPFVERQNMSNSYGDNAQDFFLTIRQRDWSQGEQQKFFRAGQDGRYWMGSNVEVSTPGQITLAPSVTSLTFASAVVSGARETQGYRIVVASATNLYRVDESGAITDLGAHGLGAAPSKFGMVCDGLKNYMTSYQGGSGVVRKWDGTTFSTFSASPADAIEFLNNTLYGIVLHALVKWDSAGAQTTIFAWKGADGSEAGSTFCRLHAYGGKLLILTSFGQEAAELWIYDGTSPTRLEVFPENFVPSDMEVLYGIVYIGGAFMKPNGTSNINAKPSVIFYDGSIGKLWEANNFNATTNGASTYVASGPNMALGVSNGRLIFTDETTGNIMAYNPSLGGVSTIASFTPNVGSDCRLVSTGQIQVLTRNQTAGYFLPASTYPTTGYVISSLVDFDSSLSKAFRGIKVEWDAASDGDGGSVDIAYQIDSLAGSWTTLKTGATSGTEYILSGVSGHAIAVKLTINKGTSTAGPTLKGLSIRGAPVMPVFARGEYIIDCTATQDNPRELRDGTDHPLSGYDQVQNLVTARNSTTPISITDKINGTYTGFVDVNDPEGFDVYEEHPDPDNPKKAGSYVVRLTTRGV